MSHLPDEILRAGSRALFSRSWRLFLGAVEAPRRVQEARLLALIERAKDTAFGREHRFSEVRSLEAYQSRVPPRSYDELAPYLDRMRAGEACVLIPDRPFFYARTSGTTGLPKHIPVTEAYVSEYRRPRRVWARQVMQAFPGLVRGRVLTMHSPRIEGHAPDGTPVGSVTVGLTASRGATERPSAGNALDPGPRSVYGLEDFHLKYHVILRLAAQERITLAAAVNPSTLVLLAQRLDQLAEILARELEEGTFTELDRLPAAVRGDVARALRRDREAAARIRRSKDVHGYVVATDLWPEIQGLLCWKGGAAPFYLAQLERWFPGRRAMDYGFLATEGGFSIPLSPEARGGVVAVLGHVLEFVPEDDLAKGDASRAVLADALDLGARYKVLVTGAHGLYRYDINDVVECVGRCGRTAEIAFVHKGGNILSITGEKVAESHVVSAAERAAREAGAELLGFSVALELGDPPRYLFGAELDPRVPAERAAALLEAFERALRAENIEYGAKRDSERLGAPKLLLLEPGAFVAERARRVADGAPDSHVKPPHLVQEAALLRRLGVIRELEQKA